MGFSLKKGDVVYSSKYKDEKGNPVPVWDTMSEHEKKHALWSHRLVNSRIKKGYFANAFSADLGAEIPITTLTTIVKRVSEQKFYEIGFADYIPVAVGNGTWSSNLTTYRSFDIASNFEEGIINQGTNNTRLAVATAGVDALNIKVNNWAFENGWTIVEIEQAAKSGNWDLIAAKEKSRKRAWDLGLQRVAFLGAIGQNGSSGPCLGLLNQAGITSNDSLITGAISAMSDTQIDALVQGLLQAYRANCNYTAYPSHFIMPESDYNGMGAQVNPAFPVKTKLEYLTESLQTLTHNKDFKVLPLTYCQASIAAKFSTTLPFATQQYVLLNYDEDSIRMDIPLDYTNTLANSVNNFMFQNAAYGQFTGVLAYRPAELLYLGF